MAINPKGKLTRKNKARRAYKQYKDHCSRSQLGRHIRAINDEMATEKQRKYILALLTTIKSYRPALAHHLMKHLGYRDSLTKDTAKTIIDQLRAALNKLENDQEPTP